MKTCDTKHVIPVSHVNSENSNFADRYEFELNAPH